MMKIVATIVVASRSPERRPTATPTARAKIILEHEDGALCLPLRLMNAWDVAMCCCKMMSITLV